MEFEHKLSEFSPYILDILTNHAKEEGKDVNTYLAEFFYNLAMCCASYDTVWDYLDGIADAHFEEYKDRIDEFAHDRYFRISYLDTED